MIRHEIKLLLSNRMNKILLIFLFAIAVSFSIFAVWSISFVDNNGNTHNGILAPRKLCEKKSKYAGKLNPDVFEDVIKKDKKIKAIYKNQIPEKIYATNTQEYMDIKDFMVSTLSYGSEMDYEKFDFLEVSKAKNIYHIRKENIKKLVKEYGVTEKKMKYLKEKFSKNKTPFYYEPADSWITMGLYATTYSLILIIGISFLVSGIFTEDFKLKADSIFFSTKLGKNKGVKIKIGTGLLMTTIIYWALMLSLCIISFTIMGVSGAKSPIQLEYSYCIYNYTFFERYLLIIIGGYFGSIFASVLTMLTSAKTHSSLLSLCIPIILFVVSPFIGRVLPFENLFKITPDQLVNIYNCIKLPILYEIFGHVFMQIPMIIILYLLISIILIPFIYFTSRKYGQK